MPKSRTRPKAVFTPPPARSERKRVSPPWVPWLMLGLFLLGIVWIVVYYVTGADVVGLRALGNWNLLVGFGLIIAGFVTATQWR